MTRAGLVLESTKDETPKLGETLEYMRLLWAVEHSLQRVSKRMEVDAGVTSPQRLVLRIIGRFPGIAAGSLARILHLHPSTLTGILQRLDKRGYLRRKADPADARRVLLSLSPKGSRLDSNSVSMEVVFHRALSRLSPEERVTLKGALAVIAEDLNRE